jgi:diacylglycerol kinase
MFLHVKLMKSNKFSVKARLESFRFALSGFRSLFKNEHNSRIHILAATVAAALGIILKLNLPEWSALIIVIGMVFIAELFNSSLESLADRVDPELNELIRRAKDYSAAAVLTAAIVAIIVGSLIFIPKLLNLI